MEHRDGDEILSLLLSSGPRCTLPSFRDNNRPRPFPSLKSKCVNFVQVTKPTGILPPPFVPVQELVKGLQLSSARNYPLSSREGGDP